jgi:2'-5' RNA ligase
VATDGHPSSFVALVVSDGPWRAALLEDLPPRVRALHPADVHVTLAFLGGVTPERARAAFDAAAAVPLRALDARLGPVVPLGPEGRWTALSALLVDAPPLVAAMKAVRTVAAVAAAVAEETREPLPHVTIARLHAKASPAERAAAVRWAEERRPTGALHLDRLALYTGRRHKDPGAPAYDVVAEATLG